MMSAVKKFFLSEILRKKYYREGTCKGCGRCCENIYISHGKDGFIKTKEEFELLKISNFFYRDLEIIGEDEIGILFKCHNLDSVSRKCKIHWRRPLLCRKYPMEEIFKMGGALAPDCGYKLKPIKTFKDILSKLEK